jgi:hypothetical protein
LDRRKYSKKERGRKFDQESRWRIVALPKCLSLKIGEETIKPDGQIGDVPTTTKIPSNYKKKK